MLNSASPPLSLMDKTKANEAEPTFASRAWADEDEEMDFGNVPRSRRRSDESGPPDERERRRSDESSFRPPPISEGVVLWIRSPTFRVLLLCWAFAGQRMHRSGAPPQPTRVLQRPKGGADSPSQPLKAPNSSRPSPGPPSTGPPSTGRSTQSGSSFADDEADGDSGWRKDGGKDGGNSRRDRDRDGDRRKKGGKGESKGGGRSDSKGGKGDYSGSNDSRAADGEANRGVGSQDVRSSQDARQANTTEEGWTAAGRGGRGRSGPQTPQQQQQQQLPDPPAVSGITQASRAGWNGSSPGDFADLPVTSPKSDDKADRRQAARPERAVYVPPKRNEDPGPQVAAQGGKKGGRGKGRGPSQDARDNR